MHLGGSLSELKAVLIKNHERKQMSHAQLARWSQFHLVPVVVPAVGTSHNKHPVFSATVFLFLGGKPDNESGCQAKQGE